MPNTRLTTSPQTTPIHQKFLADGKIVTYEISVPFTRELIDNYVDLVIQTMAAWPKHRPYLALQNFSYGMTLLTPYAKTRTLDIMRAFPDRHGRVATVTEPCPRLEMARLWLQRENKHRRVGLPHLIFFEQAEALAWLQEALIS